MEYEERLSLLTAKEVQQQERQRELTELRGENELLREMLHEKDQQQGAGGEAGTGPGDPGRSASSRRTMKRCSRPWRRKTPSSRS